MILNDIHPFLGPTNVPIAENRTKIQPVSKDTVSVTREKDRTHVICVTKPSLILKQWDATEKWHIQMSLQKAWKKRKRSMMMKTP